MSSIVCIVSTPASLSVRTIGDHRIPPGVRLADELIEAHLDNEKTILVGLSLAEQSVLASLLARLAENATTTHT